MSRWNADTGTIERYEPRLDPNHPGWLWVDCGCCAGILWGGEEPQECYCNSGWVAVHIASGTMALYPGGPFVGGRMDLATRRYWETQLAQPLPTSRTPLP